MMKKLSGAIAVAAMLFASANSSAATVTISGQGASDGQWDLSTVLCDRLDAGCQGTLVSQEWFGSSSLAEAFAEACFECLGYPNQPPAPGDYTPWFMWQAPANGVLGWAYFNNNGSPLIADFSGGTDTQYWATATRISVPEPGSLALVGLSLFGLAALRRKTKA